MTVFQGITSLPAARLLSFGVRRRSQAVAIDGVIRGRTGGPALSYDAWCALIRQRPELVPPAPREGRNPFTGEPQTFYPRPDAASVCIAGQVVGNVAWSQSGEDEVVVSGEDAVVVSLARELAAALDGEFEELS
jgi:hypothetical protein